MIEVCGVPDAIPAGLRMLRAGGRYTVAGFVNPNADVTIDANVLVRQCVTLRGSTTITPGTLCRHSPLWWPTATGFPLRTSLTRASR